MIGMSSDILLEVGGGLWRDCGSFFKMQRTRDLHTFFTIVARAHPVSLSHSPLSKVYSPSLSAHIRPTIVPMLPKRIPSHTINGLCCLALESDHLSA